MSVQPNPNWRGDPTFLPDVLKLFGVAVKEHPGWRDRGHGDVRAIQGIVVHHTGSNQLGVDYIARHPQLGLCSQIHLDRKGVATLCGAGIAWHAGAGDYPGWPTDAANMVSIGIEANSDGKTPWPAEMLDVYYRVCAAILWFLGLPATPRHLIGHKEYSGRRQGKWDPGGIEMDAFRRSVQRYIDYPPHLAGGAKPNQGANTMNQFDKIETRYRSRVEGSEVTLRPVDALLNADAHAFVSRANTEDIKEMLAELAKRFDDINKRLEKIGL